MDMAVIVRLNVGMKSIGEVAARFGLPTHVLRYWEAEGLLTPARACDRRRYTDADLHRVAAIGDLEGGGLRTRGYPDDAGRPVRTGPP